MSDITHTVEIKVPAWAWDVASKGLRGLRQLHRAMGGTSRMVKAGDVVTFTAAGPADAVLGTTTSVLNIGKAIAEKRQEARERLYKGAEQERSDFMDRLMDGLIERKLIR
jgi:DUF917 family protein